MNCVGRTGSVRRIPGLRVSSDHHQARAGQSITAARVVNKASGCGDIGPRVLERGNPLRDRGLLGARTALAYKTQFRGGVDGTSASGCRRRSPLTVHLKLNWGKPAVLITVRNCRGEGKTRSSTEPAGHRFPTRLHFQFLFGRSINGCDFSSSDVLVIRSASSRVENRKPGPTPRSLPRFRNAHWPRGPIRVAERG